MLNCINSLMKSTYQNIEILVVDNISSDDSHTKCKKQFPDIKLIQNKKNLGYCGGNNVGIKEPAMHIPPSPTHFLPSSMPGIFSTNNTFSNNY